VRETVSRSYVKENGSEERRLTLAEGSLEKGAVEKMQ